MKSQVFSEKQIKDLAEGKEVVVVEPVKKGEYLDVHPTKGTPCIMIKYLKETMMSILSFVGEEFSVKNKKGEKQWWCPKCKSFWIKGTKKFACKHIFVTKPLLVRLDKIEEQIVFSVEKHYFETDLKNPDNRYCSRYRHLKKEINFKPKVNQEVWLQNFRRIE